MKNKQTKSNNSILTILFSLSFLEFTTAAILTVQLEPDPKNSVVFGYSPSRWALLLLTIILAFYSLALTWPTAYRTALLKKMESLVRQNSPFGHLIIFLLAILAFLVSIIPMEFLGKWGLYFERVRPLLFVLCLFPAQISINWLKKDWHWDWHHLYTEFIYLCILLVLVFFILFSGLGITPEQDHWNVAGNPLTMLQLTLILFVGIALCGLYRLISPQPLIQKYKYFDLIVLVILFVVTVFLWQGTPAHSNEFSTQPSAPYFQIFPTSDARVHDVGALSILKGSGILFKTYTDKPLYIVFLAILHFFAGYDYNLLTFLHICFMALSVPGLYLIGKSFHSRMFGFVLASIILIRQQNAILLSNVLVYNALATQLMTEVPTLLGLIIATGALFWWLKDSEKSRWQAFVVGEVVGAVSLIRLNPFLLVITIPAFLFLVMYQQKRKWMIQSISFLLGSCILIAPWLLTGTNQDGQSFFLLKFQDIINVRYGYQDDGLRLSKDAVSSSASSFFWEGPLDLPNETSNPTTAGPSLPPVDIHKFPGFVINHTLHNFVGSFLTLPDSLQPSDQLLPVLMQRTYWKIGVEQLSIYQIPFIFLNLCLLAIGLAWSWKRWKWAGFAPLFVFVTYSLSLGFGRTSGLRYLVAIDWVVDFYFALGIISLLKLLPDSLRQTLDVVSNSDSNPSASTKKTSTVRIILAVMIFAIATFIPVAQWLVPPQKSICQPITLTEMKVSPPLNSSLQKKQFVYGEIIYPEIKKGHFYFGLLTCTGNYSFEIVDFPEKLDIGQRIIAGLSGDSKYPRIQLIALPPEGSSPAKIIWTGKSK